MNQTRFGRLTVLGEAWGTFYGIATTPTKNWRCLCDCGVTVVVPILNVKRGLTKSCGCYRRQWATERKLTHGLTGSPEYMVWSAMRRRCNNPKVADYPHYGGRGIKVCARWNSFEAFLADMGNRPDKLTLDRKDTNGDYTPENCRWATQTTQQNNRRDNSRHEHAGEYLTLAQIARRYSIPAQTVRNHLVLHGRSVQELLSHRGL